MIYQHISRSDVRRYAKLAGEGSTIKQLALASGIPATRIARCIRLFEMYGEGAFPVDPDSLNSNNVELRQLVDRHGMTRSEIADWTQTSPHTVKNWLRPQTSGGFRAMPSGYLELVRLKAGSVYADSTQAQG